MIDREDYGNTKLINSIKDEDYKKLVIRNGFCIGLIDFSEEIIEEKYTSNWFHNRIITRKIKIKEFIGLYKHTWNGESVEYNHSVYTESLPTIHFEFRLNKSLKLDKHTLNGKAIKNMSIFYDNCWNDIRLYVAISTSNKKVKRYETEEGIKLPYNRNSRKNEKLKFFETRKGINLEYNNIIKKFETMTWHILRQKGNDEWPAELWIRLDFKNNRGEVYLDVDAKISMIISMMKS